MSKNNKEEKNKTEVSKLDLSDMNDNTVIRKDKEYETIRMNDNNYFRFLVEGIFQSATDHNLLIVMKFNYLKFIKCNYKDITDYKSFANIADGIIKNEGLDRVNKLAKEDGEYDYIVKAKWPMNDNGVLKIITWNGLYTDYKRFLLKKVKFEVLVRDITIKKMVNKDKKEVNCYVYPVFELNSDFILVDDPYNIHLINSGNYSVELSEKKKQLLEDRIYGQDYERRKKSKIN